MLFLVGPSEPALGIAKWIFFVNRGSCFKRRFSPLYSELITSAFYIVWETPKCCPSPSRSGVVKQGTRQLSSQKSQRDFSLCPLLPLAPITLGWREQWCDITSVFLISFLPFFMYLFISQEDFLIALVSVGDQNAMPRRPKSAVTSQTPLRCWKCQTSLSKCGQLPAHKAFGRGWALIPAVTLNVVSFYR